MTDTAAAALAIVLATAKGFEYVSKRIRRSAIPPDLHVLEGRLTTAESEINRLREWRHNDYVAEINRLYATFVSRRESDLIQEQNKQDRENLWNSVRRLESRIDEN